MWGYIVYKTRKHKYLLTNKWAEYKRKIFCYAKKNLIKYDFTKVWQWIIQNNNMQFL